DIASGGVRAFICDSTNVFSPAPGRSEAGLAEDIGALIEGANGLVVATTFASNVARLKTLAQAAQAAGRSVCVLGRAMQRMLGYARGAGLIDDFPPVVDLEDAHEIPRDHLMLIVTGSQGERRAASAQLANGKYLGFRLQEGDLFLFSSKTIPGNEVGVSRVINQMSEMGVRVIDDSDGRYHVSGHANRPDLERAHGIFKPRIVVPMHGEHRHLRAHADLARAAGMESLVAPNGTVVDLTQNAPKVVDAIEAGRTYLDGSVLIGAFDGVVLDRVRMATRGTVVVALMVEDGALVGDPWAEALGMPEDANAHAALQDTIEAAIAGELGAMLAKGADDEAIERATVRAVHRVTKDQVGKKPVVRVLINHLT
ncbi:MAG: ribonuclease J, partial [Pseudomonadota bacterium]